MAAAVAGGDCPLALQMHQRLRSAGLRPDGLTYTVLIQVGACAGSCRGWKKGWSGWLRRASAQCVMPALASRFSALSTLRLPARDNPGPLWACPFHWQAYGRMGRVSDAMSTFEALLKDRSASADLRARELTCRLPAWHVSMRREQPAGRDCLGIA